MRWCPFFRPDFFKQAFHHIRFHGNTVMSICFLGPRFFPSMRLQDSIDISLTGDLDIVSGLQYINTIVRGRQPLILGGHMLIDFLDAIGISHDGEGSVDELPDELDQATLQNGVDLLFEKYPEEEAALYLKVFQQQTEEGWPELQAILDNDPRLQSTPAESEG